MNPIEVATAKAQSVAEHQHKPADGTLKVAFLLTGVILVVESVAGFMSHSLALLSDAGHILTDAVAIGLAWFAVAQSKRPADARRTYGYHRVGILAAMLNGCTLILIVFAIGYEAVQRFRHPEPIQGIPIIVSALVAIAVNTYIALRLHGDHENINLRAAMLHVLGDLAASLGVVIAGVIILLTGWPYADPLISVGIALLIAWGAFKIVLDSIHILLEGTPPGIDLEQVRTTFLSAAGVDSVHDLHVWSLTPQQIALSCHVVVAEDPSATEGEHLIRGIEQQLCERFKIGHTTIQLERCHPCDGGDRHGPGDHNHPHAHDERTHEHDGH